MPDMQICADHPLLEVCWSGTARRCSPEVPELSGVNWGSRGVSLGPVVVSTGGSEGSTGISEGSTGVSEGSTGSTGSSSGAGCAVVSDGGVGEAVAEASLLLTSPVDAEESEEMLESGVTGRLPWLLLLARGEVGMAPLGFFILADPSLNMFNQILKIYWDACCMSLHTVYTPSSIRLW